MSAIILKNSARSRVLAGALLLLGLAAAFAAEPTAEELLRGVQVSDTPSAPAPDSSAPPPTTVRTTTPRTTATRDRARERARALVKQLEERTPPARAATGLKSQTAEDLLRGAQGGEAPPAPAAPAAPARPAAHSGGQTAEDLLRGVQAGEAPAAPPTGARGGQTAEDLLRGAQSGQTQAAPATAAPASRTRRRTDRFDAAPRASGGSLLKPSNRKPESLAKYFVDSQKDAEYAGTDRCLACHKAYGEEGRASLTALYAVSEAIIVQQRRGCEGCHGPGSKHADGKIEAITNPRKLTKMGQADLCFSCHAVSVRAGDPIVHFPGHSENHVSCMSCHRVHQPVGEKFLKDEPNRLCISCHREVATEFLRRSRHPVAPETPSPRTSERGGKMRCIDCHLNWSRRRDPNGREPTVDTCQTCHAETRGPFLFSHDAGSAEMVNGCQSCHQPHGSPNRHLLRASGRSLCISCHSDFATGHFPGPTCTTTACHQDIHGSNTNVFLVR